MSDAPHKFNFHIGDYLRDTEELSLLQHGAYLRLMLWYYSTARGLPNDLERICRRIGAVSREERHAAEYVLTEFFRLEASNWTHKRIDEELAKWNMATQTARTNARSRWEKFRIINNASDATAMQRQCNGNANPDASLLPVAVSLLPVALKTLGEVSPKPPLVAQARDILVFLNSKTGKTFRPLPANTDPICQRLKEGATFQEIKSVIAKKVRDWHGDEKMCQYLRPKTLFSKTNFANYLGELNVQNQEMS